MRVFLGKKSIFLVFNLRQSSARRCDLVVKKANREAAYAFARLPETEEAAAAVRLVVARCGVGGWGGESCA